MNYRVLSRLFAIFDLVLSIIGLVLVSMFGYLLLAATFVAHNPRATEIIAWWLAYTILAFFCFLTIISCRRLLKATEKRANPAEAIQLCQLWWILAWISMILRLLAFIIETFIILHVFSAHVVNGEGYIRWKYYGNITYLVLQGFALFCVHKFKRQMKATIPYTVTESLIPIDDQELWSYQSSQSSFPPSYEEIKSSAVYEPNPPYNPSVSINPY